MTLGIFHLFLSPISESTFHICFTSSVSWIILAYLWFLSVNVTPCLFAFPVQGQQFLLSWRKKPFLLAFSFFHVLLSREGSYFLVKLRPIGDDRHFKRLKFLNPYFLIPKSYPVDFLHAIIFNGLFLIYIVCCVRMQVWESVVEKPIKKMRKQMTSPSVVSLVQGALRRSEFDGTSRIDLAVMMWHLFDDMCNPRCRSLNTHVVHVELLREEIATYCTGGSILDMNPDTLLFSWARRLALLNLTFM